jgi:hypothetical protein
MIPSPQQSLRLANSCAHVPVDLECFGHRRRPPFTGPPNRRDSARALDDVRFLRVPRSAHSPDDSRVSDESDEGARSVLLEPVANANACVPLHPLRARVAVAQAPRHQEVAALNSDGERLPTPTASDLPMSAAWIG